jgi:hypothetical protein
MCYGVFMPATPGWHAHLPTIRRTLTAMTATPWLDRRAIERLFGLRARQANYLMRAVPGRRLGTAVVIEREALLAHLDRLDMGERRGAVRAAASSPVARKASVLEAIDALRREQRPRRVSPPPPPPGANTSLPAGVRVAAPGELTLAFASPEELLGRILGLAQAAAADFADFATSLEFARAVGTDSPGEVGERVSAEPTGTPASD